MRNVKTAISIEQTLFEEVDELARKMKVSRSRVFALAARAFIHNSESRELLDAINDAYGGPPDEEEVKVQSGMNALHLRMVKGSW
jgi:NTP pyrophosphatase (non-canonical NTP hydrolase)